MYKGCDSTRHLVYISSFKIKMKRKKHDGQKCVMYNNMNEDRKSINHFFPLYQTHTPTVIKLTKAEWVTYICVVIGSDNGLSPGRRHYLKQCWNMVKWTLRNQFSEICYWHSNISIQENAFENAVCEMGSILSQPKGVQNKNMKVHHHAGVYKYICIYIYVYMYQ